MLTWASVRQTSVFASCFAW